MLPVLALICGGCASEHYGVAVKRGQAHVERSDLPLLCIVFGTKNIGMPIQSVTVRNVAEAKGRKFIVSKSFGDSHPDYLTAVSGDTVFCLLTLRLEPGEYLLEEVEYTGGASSRFEYTFNFMKFKKLKIRVLDGVVNYAGTVKFDSSWRPSVIPAYDSRVSYSERIPASIVIESTAARDRKWVYDQIPGMRDLPAVVSEVMEIP